MTFKPMKQAKLEYFLLVLEHFEGNKTDTARELGISIRTARTYAHTCKREGIKLPQVTSEEETVGIIDLSYSLPTNDERLKHLDGDKRFKRKPR